MRACRTLKNPLVPFFPTAAKLRTSLSLDELLVLYNDYFIVRRTKGPIVADMSDEEMNAWLRRLENGGSKLGLSFLSVGMLIDLVSFSAEQIAILRKAKSLPGSQPVDGTGDSAETPTANLLSRLELSDAFDALRADFAVLKADLASIKGPGPEPAAPPAEPAAP